MDVLIGVVFAVLATVFAVIKWSGNTEEQSKPEFALERFKAEISGDQLAREPNSHSVQLITEASIYARIPQESVLKRHFVTHIQYMLETVASRPTDSVLSRHHDQLLSAELTACLESSDKLDNLQIQFDRMREVLVSAT